MCYVDIYEKNSAVKTFNFNFITSLRKLVTEYKDLRYLNRFCQLKKIFINCFS